MLTERGAFQQLPRRPVVLPGFPHFSLSSVENFVEKWNNSHLCRELMLLVMSRTVLEVSGLVFMSFSIFLMLALMVA